MDAGLIGGIAGSVLGVLGGVIGTWFSIKNTNGPRERVFMVRTAAIAWVAITLFLVLLLSLPQPYNFLMWLPYGILLPLGIRRTNRIQAEIRIQEQSDSNTRQEN